MKYALALLFIPALALAGALDAPPTSAWSIKGKVLSVNDDGVLVSIVDDGSFGMPKPPAGSVVFVLGVTGLVDDDPINVTGYPVGTYKYESAGNAAKTVRAFRVR